MNNINLVHDLGIISKDEKYYYNVKECKEYNDVKECVEDEYEDYSKKYVSKDDNHKYWVEFYNHWKKYK